MQTQKSAEITTETPPINTIEKPAWQTFLLPWKDAARAVTPAFLLTRLVFLLLSYFGGVLFFVSNYYPGHRSFHDVLYAWNRWDAARFTTIATRGYISPDYTAFFPLFPALTRALSTVTHLDALLSGMIISNIAYFLTLMVLFRFVETEFDRETAGRTVLYLSIFPTAMFFFAAYNESLFLCFLLLSFYALRRGHWWLGGLAGCLAMLTRSISIFLVLIFLWEFARQRWPELQQARRQHDTRALLRQFASLPAILLIPLGLVIYAFSLQQRFHDPLAFMHAQVYWRKGLSFPWVAPLGVIRDMLRTHPLNFSVAHSLIDLTALILFLVLIVLCVWGPEHFSRGQWSLVLFGALALLYAVLFPGLTGAHFDRLASTQRFVLEIFPGFILLARLGRRPWFHQSYLLLALPMLAFFVIQFITGHWTV